MTEQQTFLNRRRAKLAELMGNTAAEAAPIYDAWAKRGATIRKRYENACNYPWATTDEYSEETEKQQRALVADVEARGLHAYAQEDCRGVLLYVAAEPLTNQNYDRALPVYLPDHEAHEPEPKATRTKAAPPPPVMETAGRAIAADVLAVLEDAEASDDGVRLTGQLDRKLYTRVNEALESAGFKWNKKAKAHTHPEASPAEALDSLLSGGVVVRPQDFGFFETQGAALDRLMELADVQPGEYAYEPSAGTGKIVARLKAAGAHYFANEIQPKNFDKLQGQYFIAGGVTCADFLTIEPAPAYDVVAMNPPFAKQADLDHVLHALRFLKPGGRLVSIMGAGVRFRDNAKTRAFHAAIADLSPTWEDLPAGSFKDSGTMTNTCILSLRLPA